MDKTLEIVVVAAILMIIAGVAYVLVSDSTGDFVDTGDNQITSAECDLWAAQADRGNEKAEERFNNNCDGATEAPDSAGGVD
jgi:hypothetical protein